MNFSRGGLMEQKNRWQHRWSATRALLQLKEAVQQSASIDFRQWGRFAGRTARIRSM